MNVDKALANFYNSYELRRGGDTGKRRVEHRSILQLGDTQLIEIGQYGRALITNHSPAYHLISRFRKFLLDDSRERIYRRQDYIPERRCRAL